MLLASLILAGAACGRPASEPDLQVRDIGVVLETTAPFAQRSDFQARLETTIQAALDYWGGDWSDLSGKTLTLSDDSYVTCGGNASSLGCYDGNLRLTTKDPALGTFSCVEATVLVHEIGHAVIGDENHEDPRWMEMDTLDTALSGRVGYTAAGEVDCKIYLSVWRHPIGTT